MQPEGDVGAARLAQGIAGVPGERQREHHEAGRKNGEAGDRRRFREGADGGDGGGADRQSAGGDGYRDLEARPVRERRHRAERTPGEGPEHPMRSDGKQRERRKARRQHSADEGAHQQDARQRHAALAGEELGQAPARDGEDHAGRMVEDTPAEPVERDQHKDERDGDEDIAEAGEQPEGFFVGRRRGPPPLDEDPKFRRRLRVDRAGDDGGVEIFVVELHAGAHPLKAGGRGSPNLKATTPAAILRAPVFCL